MVKKIYFLRHGLSQANLDGVFADFHNPLTEEGRSQAAEAALRVAAIEPKIDLIVSSPQLRAKDTAQIVADIIGYPIEAIEYNDKLVERSFGVLEGTPGPVFYQTYGPEAVDNVEEAETLAALHERAVEVLEFLKPQDGYQAVLIVSHGAFGRAIRRAINNEPQSNEYNNPTMIDNCEIIELL